MRCPTCRVEMTLEGEWFVCPACRGEFFPAVYFKRREEPAYLEAWEWSMRRYWKALRDERAVARWDHRAYRFLRTLGRERETWDAVMGLL